MGVTEEIATLSKEYCGAVAVSWYRSHYTLQALRLFLEAGVKTNIHFVLNKKSINEAVNLLKYGGFPETVNAVVFLLHKPIGLGTCDNILHLEDIEDFLRLVTTQTFKYKIGFDSCSVPALINNLGIIDSDSLDTCEGADIMNIIKNEIEYKGDAKMGKRVYISADYSVLNGDRSVVNVLHSWRNDRLHKVDYIDTAQVISGSVSADPDCRACDLKAEFNTQINASSAVIFIIGDKTSLRTAGSFCRRINEGSYCSCTPYKQNANGSSICKINGFLSKSDKDVGVINTFSYLEHEFRQAEKKNKTIIIVYNSIYNQCSWLPPYMSVHADRAVPFWIKTSSGNKIGNYYFIKKALGYELNSLKLCLARKVLLLMQLLRQFLLLFQFSTIMNATPNIIRAMATVHGL